MPLPLIPRPWNAPPEAPAQPAPDPLEPALARLDELEADLKAVKDALASALGVTIE